MALSDNLVSYWELEETSGTRVDSHGSNDLTDINTVGQGTGIQGNGADFESSNSEYLRITDASQTGLDSTTAYSIQTWVYLESKTANWSPASKGNDDTAGNLFQLFWLTSNNLIFRHLINTSTLKGVTYSWNPSLTTWYHIVGTFSTTNGTRLYINGSLVGSDSDKNPAVDTTEQFTIGARSRNNGAALDMYMDGIVDEVGFWSKELTSTEVSDLYNSGDGIPYEAAAASTFIPRVSFIM